MLAATFSRSPDPSVLRVEKVPDPGPPTGDRILVRVAASSLNGTDLGLSRGASRSAVVGRLAKPGFDLAGEVVACGPQVTAFAPGDRVAALLPHSGGGLAEQIVLRQGRATRVPDQVSDVDAAAVPLAGLTALQALFGRAGLGVRHAPRVLVHGASGGIGAFAVQLAALAGGRVTGTARAGKQEFVRELGAADVLDSRADDPTAGGPWDVVLDTPGALDPARVRPALAPGGVLVTTRVASLQTARELTRSTLRSAPQRFAFVATSARSQDLARLLELVRTGRLAVPVDRVFPLEELEEAYRYLAGGEVRGKVVVTTA